MPSTATSILDGISTSVAIKPPCVVAAIVNITLAGLQTVNGVVVVEGDRVLATAQTSAVNNGIYIASTGQWQRAADADGNRDLVSGTRVMIQGTGDGVGYELLTDDPIIIGTTPLSFVYRAIDSALRTDIASAVAGVTGARLVGYRRSEAGAVATTVAATLSAIALTSQFGVVGNGITDDTAALQAAATAVNRLRLPAGTYKITSPIVLHSGSYIDGEQQGGATTIEAWGCDAFTIPAGAAVVTIENLQGFSKSAVGVADPKTNRFVHAPGTNGNHVNYVFVRNCYLRGWNQNINFEFTWNSVIDNVTTVNCNISVRLLSQCCNNSITNSRLVANTGTHAIKLEIGAGPRGEGLMVSNTLLAQGTYGVQCDNFLSLNMSNCIIDVITDRAFDLTNLQSLVLANCWIFAANYGLKWNNLGGITELNTTITGCRIETTTAAGKPVSIGDANKGISIIGGSIVCVAGTQCVELINACADISIIGTNLVNPGANPSITANALVTTFVYSGLTGNATVQGVAMTTIASAAAITLPIGDVFKISGVTNITSITNTFCLGRRVTLIFQGILTFTDGSNLKLAGNFVTTADDTITLVCDEAGNWIETGRSVN